MCRIQDRFLRLIFLQFLMVRERLSFEIYLKNYWNYLVMQCVCTCYWELAEFRVKDWIFYRKLFGNYFICCIFLGPLPSASLSHTPSASSSLAHNLTDLNDKLVALSQKMQGEQNEEVSYSSNEVVTPLIPTQQPLASGTITPGITSATPEAGILHVDTLNELADALQKVIIRFPIIWAWD